MNDYLKSALEIVKAQATLRPMSEDEILSMAAKLAQGLAGCGVGEEAAASPANAPALDHRKSIREASVVCLECGKNFKVLTKRHLASHGLTPAEYREKHGLKKGLALACKALTRERRKKMTDMKLWERRGKPATA